MSEDAEPVDNDDLLRKILVCLPSQPSSLPRFSSVCKRWRRLATDPQFLRLFRAHHRKPPILGFFEQREKIVFSSILDPPDRILPERLSLRRGVGGSREGVLLGCRHGRLFVMDGVRHTVIVYDPITGERRRVGVPPEFKKFYVTGTVLCAAADPGHVHGGCHSNPFKVVLVSMYRDDHQPIACVYSSETGVWGNVISTAVPCRIFSAGEPAILAGNALYWLLGSDDMLEFHLDRQSLAVINGPPSITNDTHKWICRIIQAEDGNVGLAMLAYPSFQMWQRKVNCYGVATWVLRKTDEIRNILGLPHKIDERMEARAAILGYAEDAHVIFLYVDSSVYIVQLESMQARRLDGTSYGNFCHSFTSFYTPGDCSSSVLNTVRNKTIQLLPSLCFLSVH